MLPKFISLLALFALLHPLINARYTLDACSTDSDCASPRVCLQFGGIADIGPCEPADENCICTEIGEQGLPNFRSCRFDDECLEGDTCQSSGNTRRTNCISKCQEEGANNCPDKSKGPKPTKTPKPDSSSKTTGTRLTRDCCQKASDCKSPRECVAVGTALRKCKPGESCVCVPTKDPKCEDNGDCEEGEECFDGSGDQPGSEGSSRCVSTCSILKNSNPTKYESMCESCPAPSPMKSPSPSPTKSPAPNPMEAPAPSPMEAPAPESPTPEPTDAVCVAAEELAGVEKVYDRDFHAWVLCDSVGSCATPGHMVVWKGEGMMMKSYCDDVGCERKVLPVNSPRYKAGGVKAKTNGLVYTSFAARWETSAEERILAAVVRFAV